MASKHPAQPKYGERFMPKVVDDLAASEPDRAYALIPKSADVSSGFRPVSFADISKAVDYCARWIEKAVGLSKTFETLAYIGPSDLRYAVVFLAAVKCGYKLLLPSIRNSAWMTVSLLEQTKCKCLLHSPEMKAAAAGMKAETADLQALEVVPLDAMLAEKAVEHMPFNKDWETSKWDPILVLQSSGSTGPPKPIGMNHGTFSVADKDRFLPAPPGRKNQNWALWNFEKGGAFFSAFPSFHLAGFSSMLPVPIYSTSATIVLSPPDKPPSGHLVSSIMDQVNPKAMFCPPIIAEMLVKEPKGIEQCSRLDFLLYAGGPLSEATGTSLSQVTDVCQFYGQTETGPLQALVPLRENWAFLEFHPLQKTMLEPAAEGLYEMVLKPKDSDVSSLYWNFHDVDTWRTRDLFRAHPEKPDLWSFSSRVDDIVVLSNGEKFNPVPSEIAIQNHASLAGALIVGQGRFQGALIIEPKADHKSDHLVDDVWPTVEEANARAPAHARITKAMILISSPDKPFDRAPKGTIIRKSSEAKYKDELQRLYSEGGQQDVPTLTDSSNASTVKSWTRAIVKAGFPDTTIDDDQDFFVQGLDSLRTLEICSKIKAGLTNTNSSDDLSWISPRLIYEHPSVDDLSEMLYTHLNTNAEKQKVNSATSEAEMLALIEKYTSSITLTTHTTDPAPRQLNVALTGSTGSLGSYILLSLLQNAQVERVFCLNRDPKASDKMAQALSKRADLHDAHLKRVKYMQFEPNSSGTTCGLQSADYESINSPLDFIIHAAWPVDFNQRLTSFEPMFKALNDLRVLGGKSCQMIFISSLSSMLGSTENTIPETIPSTPSMAAPMGYAQSKAVAEQILSTVAKRDDEQRPSILRFGQIAGPKEGKPLRGWSEREWLPSLLISSKTLGMVPNDLPDVDWVPVDTAADIVCDVMGLQRQAHGGDGAGNAKASLEQGKIYGAKVFNVVNPHVVPWAELLSSVQARLGGAVKAVPLKVWVAELEKRPQDEKGLPAAKILDFFAGMAEGTTRFQRAETANTQAASATMRELKGVNGELLTRWMADWGL